MGTAELRENTGELIIRSHIVTYGNSANNVITERIRREIEVMWNEPQALIQLNRTAYKIVFAISADYRPVMEPREVYENIDPRINYFRIEDYAAQNISFVDGLGCNTGYFLLENLYEGSTTAAHEYGHTLGLPHPVQLDLRERGTPGIMYPRGTLVDPSFQYDPAVPAGFKGGTMHPQYRRVLHDDIQSLRLHRLRWNQGTAIVGDFSSVYHTAHTTH